VRSRKKGLLVVAMKKLIRGIEVVICAGLVAAGCSSVPANHSTRLPFDTSYSAPNNWKLVEEPKWGLRFNVPPALRDTDPLNKSLWIHEGNSLRLIVDFSFPSSSDSLKAKKNYSEVHLNVNGLSALLCSYDQSANAVSGSLNKVVALFFLETRKGLGSPYEPSYRVEFASENDRSTALQILQTVRFFDS
jgi:hypothetical protein